MEIKKPKERNLYFNQQVDQSSIGELTEKIIEINQSDEFLTKQCPLFNLEYKPDPIKIYIDSYGGLVYQCFGLIGVMEESKTPIHTIVTGAAMSCGFLMLISGHKRFAYQHATPLYHQISGAIWGEVQYMEERFEETKRLQKKMEKLVLDKTSMSEKLLKKILKRKKDYFMSANKALELGVVDDIL